MLQAGRLHAGLRRLGRAVAVDAADVCSVCAVLCTVARQVAMVVVVVVVGVHLGAVHLASARAHADVVVPAGAQGRWRLTCGAPPGGDAEQGVGGGCCGSQAWACGGWGEDGACQRLLQLLPLWQLQGTRL
jgi:hypothetical protein